MEEPSERYKIKSILDVAYNGSYNDCVKKKRLFIYEKSEVRIA